MHPLRLLSILALTWAVVRLVPFRATWLLSRPARPFIICGQHSLPVFCASIALSFLGRLVMEEQGGWPGQAIVNVAGPIALVGIGALAAWYRSKGRPPPRLSTLRPAWPPPTCPRSRMLVPDADMNVKWTRLLLIAFATMALAPPAALAEPDRCRVPDDIADVIKPLPAVAPVLKPGTVLRILAVGSATMFGPDATLAPGTVTSQALDPTNAPTVPATQALGAHATDAAFPRQMAAALQAAVPGMTVEVVLRGGRGFTAVQMLELIRTELQAGSFQLVLWQTGTVEAVRNTPSGDFAQVLVDGAEAIDAAGANLVLIDPQYSRFLQTNSNVDRYTQALQQTASLPGVLLFRRYDLMRAWVADGQFDLERTPRGERRKTVELLHRCLGQHLARMVLAGVHA